MPTFDSKFLIAFALSFTLFSSSAQACFLQDDPFGATPSDTDDPTAADDRADSFVLGRIPPISLSWPDSTRLIVRAVYESNPQTPTELAKALQTMMDVEAFDHARYFLGKLMTSSPDDQQLFELQTTVGAHFFLALHGSSEMQPEGRAFAESVFAASKRVAYDPNRVEAIVKAISSENISTRSEAFRMLRRLGAPGAAALLNVFTQPERSKEFPYVRGALKSFGELAVGPLVGGARADNLLMQVESVRALGAYKSSDAEDAMMRVYLSPGFPESVRRNALDSMMSQYGHRVDPREAENQLYQHAEDFLLGRRKLPNTSNDQVTIWRWNAATQKLESQIVPKLNAERLTAADRAEDLFEINPDRERNRRIYLLTRLESAKRNAGPSRQIEVQELIKRFPNVVEREVQAALARALELDLVPAAIGACEVLEKIGTAKWLTASDAGNSPLIDAILYGDRHLQFAALQAIDRIDPKQAFAGSSYVTALAVFLAKSDGVTSGLVGHNHINLAQSYAAAIHQSGLYGRAAESSREFFKLATQNPDHGVLLITDSLTNPEYVELAQQLRTDWRTKRTPIGLLVRDERYQRRVNRILRDDPFLAVLPATLDVGTIGSHIRRLLKLSDPWPVSQDDRRLHALIAVRWLAKISSDPESYRFWNLGSHQQALASLLYIPGFAQDASRILSSIGTPLAQRSLVDFASQNSFPLEDRQVVADAFVRSVSRSGTLLTTAEINLQYKRYNASESEPKSTQQILGKILDAIESRRDQVSSTN